MPICPLLDCPKSRIVRNEKSVNGGLSARFGPNRPFDFSCQIFYGTQIAPVIGRHATENADHQAHPDLSFRVASTACSYPVAGRRNV
jgi:hypothetical protein